MENIEQILRDYPTLRNLTDVRWQMPTGVQYGLAGFDEEVYFRVGVLELEINILY